MTPPLKVVTVGAGYFAGFHVDGWLRNPDVAFAGLADLDTGKAARLLAEKAAPGHPARIEADAAALFDSLRPDIIDIAAPPPAHLGLIRQALDTNARAIVCQKPFCGSLAEAQKAVRLIRDSGKLVVVHENFRFQPWYRAIRDEIAAGRVGELYQIGFRMRPGDGQGRDAYLSRQPYFQKMPRFLIHETAVHWIDTFRFLMGEPDAVFADLRRLNPAIAGEDAGLLLFRYADGRRAVLDGNRLVDHAAANTRFTMGECLVEGSAGVMALDGDGTLTFRPRGGHDWQRIGGGYPTTGFGGDSVYALQKHVGDHLLRGTPIENDAEAYLRNLEIEEALYDSAAAGRVVEVASR
ncbi:NADH-dependent dehydrogenase [Thalassobaculum fulvum]|uniref:NADH-dependent dehydrogenase n=1 Tax=Thalassobaculum fulvum TaxID=1633335 RepID=A0A919CNN3_9PROT|nr:Gfo/Idh/MocA family oxidoreductase [Thalassobaculum fulvum]GHD44609.1 NADH-dependent dehydrogenase [Thalassobaculum fulvum]